jgi:diguanylate cyclase (GGDEF)-like protein/PAS domain S-box-containing protein
MPRSKVGDFSQLSKIDLIKQLNNAMEIANLGMYEWDIVNDYLQLDDHLYDMTGIGRDEFTHSMKYIIDHVIHPDSLDDFLKSLSIGSPEEYDNQTLNNPNVAYRIINPQKEECYLEVISKIIFEGNKPVRLIGVMMDVTDKVIKANQYKNNMLFIESLLESIPCPMFYKDSTGIYRQCNEAFSEYIKIPREKIINKTVYDVAPKDLADVYYKADDALLKSGGGQTYESDVIDDAGNKKRVIFHKAVHLDSDNQPDGIIGLIQDVTEIRIRENYLKRVSEAQNLLVRFNQDIINYDNEREFFHEMLRAFMESYPQVTIGALLEIDENGILSIYDSQGLVLVDKNSNMMFKESLLYKFFGEKYHRVHNLGNINMSEMSPNDIGRDVLTNNPIKANIAIPITMGNHLRWVYMFSGFEENTFDKTDIELAEFIRRELIILTEVYDLLQNTIRMARYDGLTGLMNRAYFDKTIRNKLMEDGEPFVVVVLDLDNLKYINDQFGHDQGDLYIKYFSKMIKQEFKHDGFFGRMGGDEFAGIIVDSSVDQITARLLDLQIAYKKKILDLLEENIGGFSFGISSYPKDGQEYMSLLKTADARMYSQKQEKKKLK